MRLAAVAAAMLAAGSIAPTALAAVHGHAHHRAASRAPSGPPLSGAQVGVLGEGEPGAGVASAGGDQLVENGLSSPLCKGAIAGRLSAAAQSDCRTSGFIGASAPTNNYALDVHIDTGAFGISEGELLSIVQDLFIAPVWGVLGWVVHLLLAMLEWCYTLELLGGGRTSAIAAALAQARAAFTDPWLVLVLALASLLALYHGLVRRRVADTLGGAVTMLAMMAGGLWVIADPSGTVGAVGQWANQASLGTLAATASGDPSSTATTLGESIRALYAGVIETPWCYLEFGNVRWCSDPALLEPSLRAAALALHEGTPAERARSAELVRAATTNGALFLAFPANLPARNSINDEGSLLRAICRSEDATKCNGPAAAEAEFRTNGGTMPRVLGLLAIAVGVLGMALLFGLLALRLLAAAFLSLLLLLLAPLAVLAPALGDGGRAVFTTWFTRLLGAVTSKLLFSFVLGALLTMQRMLVALDALGWWTQWLLLSAFWWIVFLKRHEAAAVMRGANGPATRDRPSPGAGASGGAGHGSRGGPLARSLQTYGAIRHPKRWAQAQVNSRLASPAPRGEEDLGGSRFKLPLPAARRREGAALAGQPSSIEPGAAAAVGELADQSASPIGGEDPEIALGPAIPIVIRGQRVAAKRERERAGAEATAAVDPVGGSGGAGSGGGVGAPRRPHPGAGRVQPMQRIASAAGETPSAKDRAAGPVSSGGVAAAGSSAPALASSSAAARSDQRRPIGSSAPPIPPATGAQSAGADTTAGRSSASPTVGVGGAPMPPGGDGTAARSPIMEDAHAVAERRKRQLGFEREP